MFPWLFKLTKELGHDLTFYSGWIHKLLSTKVRSIVGALLNSISSHLRHRTANLNCSFISCVFSFLLIRKNEVGERWVDPGCAFHMGRKKVHGREAPDFGKKAGDREGHGHKWAFGSKLNSRL